MAWTVAFALLGALMFSMLLAPVLSSIFFRKGTREWHNPGMVLLTRVYSAVLGRAIHWRWVTLGVAALSGFALAIYLATSVLGSEFLPHLDEGAIWVRGILAAEYRPDRRNARGESGSSYPVLLSGGPAVHQPGGPARRRHGHHGVFQHRVFCRFEIEGRMAAGVSPG